MASIGDQGQYAEPRADSAAKGAIDAWYAGDRRLFD